MLVLESPLAGMGVWAVTVGKGGPDLARSRLHVFLLLHPRRQGSFLFVHLSSHSFTRQDPPIHPLETPFSSAFSRAMGLSVSKLLSGLFGKKEMREFPPLDIHAYRVRPLSSRAARVVMDSEDDVADADARVQVFSWSDSMPPVKPPSSTS